MRLDLKNILTHNFEATRRYIVQRQIVIFLRSVLVMDLDIKRSTTTLHSNVSVALKIGSNDAMFTRCYC